ncbi:histidine phosphatase family protein [Nannocystis pusilla]|uniref:histidine phosphatase family protein n=1 Tax=Nannocystis pusilla TaxID=889268 RepID=UPI003B8255CC
MRHGEKAADDPSDPSLSPAGEARAKALAELLGHAGVTHLFASEYRRTQATLRPLADAAGLQITVLPAAARRSSSRPCAPSRPERSPSSPATRTPCPA